MVEVVLEVEFHHVGLLGALEVSFLVVEELLGVLRLLQLDSPPVLLVVKEGALESFEALLFFAWLSFIDEGMKLLFFPSVAELAGLESFASLFVAGDEGPALPVFAELGVVSEQVGFPSVVLEVVGIHALGFVVVVVVGAPLSLEVEDVEVEVLILRKDMVDESHLDIFDGVGERAVVSVLALGDLVGEEVTELGLVLVFVVESLYSVVGSSAFVLLGALFCVCELAELRSVEVVIPSLVLDRVVEVTTLVVVSSILLGTFNPLEVLQVQVLQLHRLSGPVMVLGQVDENVFVLERSGVARVVLGVSVG
jgi:hypothetical protein